MMTGDQALLTGFRISRRTVCVETSSSCASSQYSYNRVLRLDERVGHGVDYCHFDDTHEYSLAPPR